MGKLRRRRGSEGAKVRREGCEEGVVKGKVDEGGKEEVRGQTVRGEVVKGNCEIKKLSEGA